MSMRTPKEFCTIISKLIRLSPSHAVGTEESRQLLEIMVNQSTADLHQALQTKALDYPLLGNIMSGSPNPTTFKNNAHDLIDSGNLVDAALHCLIAHYALGRQAVLSEQKAKENFDNRVDQLIDDNRDAFEGLCHQIVKEQDNAAATGRMKVSELEMVLSTATGDIQCEAKLN